MDDVSYESFAARLGHAFVLRRLDLPEPGEPLDAVLVECIDRPENAELSGYSLTFRATRAELQELPQQGTYLVEAAELTPTPIFLVPARQTRDGVDLHAVFTQLKESANAL